MVAISDFSEPSAARNITQLIPCLWAKNGPRGTATYPMSREAPRGVRRRVFFREVLGRLSQSEFHGVDVRHPLFQSEHMSWDSPTFTVVTAISR